MFGPLEVSVCSEILTHALMPLLYNHQSFEQDQVLTVPDFTLSYVSFQLLHELISLHPVDDGPGVPAVAEESPAVQDQTHACQTQPHKSIHQR